MSKEAQQWVSQLPAHATKTLIAFRVLDKLADAHHIDTDHAYRDVKKMANELVVSDRTIQRALRDLEKAELILVGNQGVLPRDVPLNRMPTAYRLPWRAPWTAAVPLEGLGVTPGVTPSDPVDNSSRGDTKTVSGVTPGVVPLEQKTEPVEDSLDPATGRACTHEYSRRYGVCVYCGAGG